MREHNLHLKTTHHYYFWDASATTIQQTMFFVCRRFVTTIFFNDIFDCFDCASPLLLGAFRITAIIKFTPNFIACKVDSNYL